MSTAISQIIWEGRQRADPQYWRVERHVIVIEAFMWPITELPVSASTPSRFLSFETHKPRHWCVKMSQTSLRDRILLSFALYAMFNNCESDVSRRYFLNSDRTSNWVELSYWVASVHRSLTAPSFMVSPLPKLFSKKGVPIRRPRTSHRRLLKSLRFRQRAFVGDFVVLIRVLLWAEPQCTPLAH